MTNAEAQKQRLIQKKQNAYNNRKETFIKATESTHATITYNKVNDALHLLVHH